jgi:hypothetical protein
MGGRGKGQRIEGGKEEKKEEKETFHRPSVLC